MRARRLPSLSAALALVACGGASVADDPADTDLTALGLEDGIVVENTVEPSSLPRWTLGETPALVLGRADSGQGSVDLHRVATAKTTPEGGVAVLDGGTDEVLLFGPDGTLLRRFGGAGDGPGEFENAAGMSVVEDLLFVWDVAHQRLTAFDLEGGFVRTVSIERRRGAVYLVSVLPDGGFIVRNDRLEYPRRGERFRETHMILVRYGPDGTPIDSLGGVPEAVMGIVPIMGAGSLQIERSGPRTRTGGSAEGAWIGTARRHEVAFWPVDGRPALLLRWPGRRLNLTEADRSAIEELTRQWTRDDPSLAETYEAWPITRSFPSYDRLVSDDSGGVWVRLYRRPGEDGPASWLAFDEEGRLRARIASPSDLQIVEVGVDAVLGRRQDALGVEHVVRLGLSRSGAPSGGPGARPPSM